jgi:hypothetical protein
MFCCFVADVGYIDEVFVVVFIGIITATAAAIVVVVAAVAVGHSGGVVMGLAVITL